MDYNVGLQHERSYNAMDERRGAYVYQALISPLPDITKLVNRLPFMV